MRTNKLTEKQLEKEAETIRKLWIMHYGADRAAKLSLYVRRLFRK